MIAESPAGAAQQVIVYPSPPVNPLALLKPEYLFRPAQIARRIRAALFPQRTARLTVPLSFGGSIQVSPQDAIGRALQHLGVYDLAVSEVIWRLAESGEAVVDIGANIGYFTRLLEARVGPDGRVIAFEAHPVLYGELCSNLELDKESVQRHVELRSEAVSSQEGVLLLAVPEEFATNRGVCHVVEEGARDSGSAVRVPAVRLDDAIDPSVRIGVVKMDVEGHEPSVLAGAERILRTRQVRDWVFEELSAESAVARTFEEYGYEVFLIERRFRGPTLARNRPIELTGRWEPPSLLATLDAARARRLCGSSGWLILSGRRNSPDHVRDEP